MEPFLKCSNQKRQAEKKKMKICKVHYFPAKRIALSNNYQLIIENTSFSQEYIDNSTASSSSRSVVDSYKGHRSPQEEKLKHGAAAFEQVQPSNEPLDNGALIVKETAPTRAEDTGCEQGITFSFKHQSQTDIDSESVSTSGPTKGGRRTVMI